MKAKVLLLKAIADEGVRYLFMVPGGLVDPFLTAFDEVPQIKPIIAAQEGGAAYMADGYARASRIFGACLGIGGPGATNMTTPILTAKSDYSPLLVVTGEVPTALEGLESFQDASIGALDDFDILKSATKLSLYVENANLFKHDLKKCMEAMKTYPQGPVHLCIPKDIQESQQDEGFPSLAREFLRQHILDEDQAKQGIDSMKGPLTAILAGEGVETSGAAELLREVAETFSIPIVTTLRAKGILSERHPCSMGVFGYAGTRHATELLLGGKCDNLIVLGSGLNQRDTMFWNAKLMPKNVFLSVNINLTGFDYTYSHITPVEGDCMAFLRFFLDNYPHTGKEQRQRWMENVRASGPRLYDEENCSSSAVPIHPARAIRELRHAAPDDTILLVDSGAHRAFCGHYWESLAPGQYLSATNLGPMGWAIPAAVGAQCAQPDKPVVCITGDGCMLMHGMEIQTAARYHLPIVYVILNNAAYGNVYLRAAKEGETPAKLTSLPDHDWVRFAEALGCQAAAVHDPERLREAYTWALKQKGTVVLDVKCSKASPTPVEPFAESQKVWSFHD